MSGPMLSTTCAPASDAFQRNAAAMSALIAELRERVERASLGGSESSRQRHVVARQAAAA